MMNPCVYILRSLVNGRYYVGSTVNIERRIAEHNRGKTTYTNLTKPFEIVFRQDFDELAEARRMERKLKRLKSRVILEKIITEGYIKISQKDS